MLSPFFPHETFIVKQLENINFNKTKNQQFKSSHTNHHYFFNFLRVIHVVHDVTLG